MKWSKRIYRLNGHTVLSSTVLGFVHTARKKKGLCWACRQPIELGQKYVVLNNFPHLGDPITVHFDEYVRDHPDECILGVKQYRAGWPIKRSYVDCEDFSVIGRSMSDNNYYP